MASIRFDALTAAFCAQALAERGLKPGLLPALMLHAASTQRQEARHGVRATITGWTAMGDPIITGGDPGTMTMKVSMAARGDARALEMVGALQRFGDQVCYTIEELGIGGKARFSRRRGGRITLEIRDALPESLANGLGVLAGRPLSDLIGDPALARPEAAGIVVHDATRPARRTTTRVGVGMGDGTQGADVVLETPSVVVDADRL